MRPVIALLTDFGLQDHYVGAMKGVMLGICPDAALVDITHDIPPQDILAGALELAAAWRYFPDLTVFLCVVDPGVGSARRGIAVRAGGRMFVAPDNGLVSLAVGDLQAEVVELADRRFALATVSRTFEGRDRFAPAAAWLASGTDFAALGPSADGMVRIDAPLPVLSDAGIEGQVVRVDRFGNLITNIDAGTLAAFGERARLMVWIAGTAIDRVSEAYAGIAAGESGALVGSTGHLEVAVNGENAARMLGCGRGAAVRVARRA